jgi:hypothetical protein
MDRKINGEQMQQLYAFTRRHFVEYYDLQAELADHLADAIEARWQEQPVLGFDEALQLEFKKFGIFGFMDVVEKRQAALSKKYNRLLWGYFREFFRLPKIMLTATLTLVYYTLLSFTAYKNEVVLASLLILTVASLARGYTIKRAYTKKVKQDGKKWLLEEIIFNAGAIGFIVLPQLCHMAYKLSEGSFEGAGLRAGCSLLFVLVAMLQYVMLYTLPQKAGQHLEEVYPEYKLQFIK